MGPIWCVLDQVLVLHTISQPWPWTLVRLGLPPQPQPHTCWIRSHHTSPTPIPVCARLDSAALFPSQVCWVGLCHPIPMPMCNSRILCIGPCQLAYGAWKFDGGRAVVALTVTSLLPPPLILHFWTLGEPHGLDHTTLPAGSLSYGSDIAEYCLPHSC